MPSPPSIRRLAALASLLAALQMGPATVARAAPTVGVSVAPLAWLAREIGGPGIEVITLIPPGASAETYTPRPKQIESLGQVDLYLAVGHPGLVIEARIIAVNVPADVPRMLLAAEQAGDASQPDDPHLWLSPRLMRGFAARVAAALAVIDPASAPLHHERARALEQRIDALSADIAQRLAGLPAPRQFVVDHPAWGWYAAEFGLEQIAIEREGKPPGPRSLIPLIETLRAAGVHQILVQPGDPHRSARVVADELGARLVVVDPLAANWPDNLRAVADRIAEGR